MKVKLGDISQIITGPFGSQLHMSDYVSDGYPVIMPQNISNRRVNEIGIARIDDSNFNRLIRYSVQPNDIIYARRGKVDEHAFIDVSKKMICGTGCFRVRVVSREVYPLFLSLYLNRSETRQWLISHAVGSNMPNLNTDILSNVPLELPEYSEQVRIAQCLQSIDDKIRINNAINDNLAQQAKLLYDYWFTQFDFPDENDKPYRSSGGQMVWNDLLKKKIPVGWEVKTLSELLKKNTQSFDYSSVQPTIDLSVMPSDSIALSQINSSDNFSTNLYVMKKGDILFGSIRPYLHKAGIAPCDGAVAGTVHSYHTINPNDYNFSLLTMARDSFFDYAVNTSSGTKMPVVSSDSILSFKFAYSKEVAKKFNSVPIMEIITRNVQETQRLIKLRDFLLPLLMNGQATIAE